MTGIPPQLRPNPVLVELTPAPPPPKPAKKPVRQEAGGKKPAAKKPARQAAPRQRPPPRARRPAAAPPQPRPRPGRPPRRRSSARTPISRSIDGAAHPCAAVCRMRWLDAMAIIGHNSYIRRQQAQHRRGNRMHGSDQRHPHSNSTAPASRRAPLIDPFARAITYLRVSVTDRCDFRCVYCMSEHMTFLPKADLLSLEELDRLCSAFIAKGVTQAAPDRRRAAGAARHHDAGVVAVAASDERRARGTDADHQRLAAGEIRRRAQRPRRRAHQRLARHARSRQVPRHHALGRSRQGAGRHRRRAGRRAQGQDQRGGAQGRQRGRNRPT